MTNDLKSDLRQALRDQAYGAEEASDLVEMLWPVIEADRAVQNKALATAQQELVTCEANSLVLKRDAALGATVRQIRDEIESARVEQDSETFAYAVLTKVIEAIDTPPQGVTIDSPIPDDMRKKMLEYLESRPTTINKETT